MALRTVDSVVQVDQRAPEEQFREETVEALRRVEQLISTTASQEGTVAKNLAIEEWLFWERINF